jgi:hypothetical protein
MSQTYKTDDTEQATVTSNTNRNVQIATLIAEVKEVLKDVEDEVVAKVLSNHNYDVKETIEFLLSDPTFETCPTQPMPCPIQTTVKLTQSEEELLSKQYIENLLKQEEEEHRRKRMEKELENERLTWDMLQKEREQREKELKNKRYTCNICLSNEKRIEEMYTLDECWHRFCFDCLREFIVGKIRDGEVATIHCPTPNCPHFVTYNEVKHLVDRRTFEKYEEFLLKHALDSDPNCRWCPRPGCHNAMIGNPNLPMMVCSNEKCQFTFCFNCREEWHADTTCEKYQKWKRENSDAENRFALWAAQHTKPCPFCNAKIEKNGGCNHMTCSKCRHEFCWLCLQPYAPNHFRNGSCTQYS